MTKRFPTLFGADTVLHLAIQVALKYRRSLAISLVLFLLSGLAEGLGVVTLLPVLSIVAGDASAPSNPLVQVVRDVLSAVNFPIALAPLLLVMVLFILTKAALNLAAMRQVGYTTANVASDLRRALLRQLMQANWGYFTRKPVGGLANVMSGEVIRASGIFNGVCQVLNQSFQAIVYGGLALAVSPPITFAAVGFGVVIFAVLYGLVLIVRDASAVQTRAMKNLVERLSDGLSGFKAIKAMGREDRIEPMLNSLAGEINRAQRREFLSIAAMSNAHEPLLTLILAIGLYLALSWMKIPFVELVFMALLFQRTVSRIAQVQGAYQGLVRTEVSYRAVQQHIDEAAEALEQNTGTERPELKQGISLQGVEFSYGSEAVLCGVDLEIPAGQFVALTGRSGSGKTTIADLIIGFNRVDKGQIMIDGLPIDQVDLRYLRRRTGYVPQEPYLLNDTVFYNVTLGDPELSRKDAEEALRAAGAWSFVAGMPGKLDYVVGERGTGLSGGQRQRIAIARALVARPHLLILDEPTTALDPETEKEICETLRAVAGEITVLAISHQPALAEIADVVYHLAKGRIASVDKTSAMDGRSRHEVASS